MNRKSFISIILGALPAFCQTKIDPAKQWMKDFDSVCDRAMDLKIEDHAVVLVVLRMATLANRSKSLADMWRPAYNDVSEALRRMHIS